MSDMRFIMAGAVLVFAGFVVLGGFGHVYHAATIESDEFGTCHVYSDDSEPAKTDCAYRVLDQTLFFAVIVGLVGAGVFSLAKGSRGSWDSNVRPEDMAGPGGETKDRP